MRTVNIHEARTHLSRLVELAAKGEGFVIAKAGKPLVKVVALDSPDAPRATRLGFMSGEICVPEDFDRMLVAQSCVEGITLLTSDRLLAQYPCPLRFV